MASDQPVIFWFRRDLRLHDNAALHAACKCNAPIVPIYIQDDADADHWPQGTASRWWLHHSLEQLMAAIKDKGNRLILIEGPCEKTLIRFAKSNKATALYATRMVEPHLRDRDRKLADTLDIDFHLYDQATLFPPGRICTKDKTVYRVFSPFWRRCLDMPEPPEPVDAPSSLRAPTDFPESLTLNSLGLISKDKDVEDLSGFWRPGEKQARKTLSKFIKDKLADYDEDRDCPAKEGVSGLSPHLHHGEISANEIWHRAKAAGRDQRKSAQKGTAAFLRELGWRDFAAHLLNDLPALPDVPMRKAFKDFPWKDDDRLRQAWMDGKTGYPFVDAGMRELLHSGYMHNRLRMVTASFLVKDLMIHWRDGEQWFWEKLVDADLANNALGWQWVAGCGPDAAPYFRIFNPVTQGERHDPDGAYVRKWVPELKALPDKFIHQPWNAPKDVLEDASLTLGKTYPKPIVDHDKARKSALSAYNAIKDKR